MPVRPPDLGPYVILMTGPPLSLKTETALRLSRFLRAGVIQSSCLGRFPTDDELKGLSLAEIRSRRDAVRDIRHSRILSLARQCLILGTPFILDSAYSNRADRQAIYELVGEHEGFQVVVVYCHCHEKLVRDQRLEHRMTDPLSAEPELTDPNYLESVRAAYQEPIGLGGDSWRGAPLEIVDFDTAVRRAVVLPDASKATCLAGAIAGFLNYEAAVGEL